MNKRTFISYISESNFQELFIREMGWNNPKGQTHFDLNIEGTNYSFTIIAERSGFQVLTCTTGEMPTASLAKKIDTRLRRQANDYICIFKKPSSNQHHLWVVPVKKVEKRDLVSVEYESAEQAQFLYEKMDKLSFDLDEQTTIMDVKERIQGCFTINSEKITSDFYKGFRKEHTHFANHIKGMDDEVKLKDNRDKQWYTSVMLNRLMFCYFIQKKGFLDQNTNYLRDKLEWVKREKGGGKFYDTFYRWFLASLFHDGLNSPRHQPDFTQKYGRIPYLNGGMFSIHELEEKYPELDIDDEAFESLFAFFDQWHWHLDDRLTATGKDINPDVLGYIFEQYINDRAQMGAYYTKEDITEYIGRNTIMPYLIDATLEKLNHSNQQGCKNVWQFLRESGDRYIFDAVRKGHDIPIPEYIAEGIDTTRPNLLERRRRWNERTPDPWALPTEIWRETVERLQRYQSIKTKIVNGEITQINDFITYNLDIRQFVQDLLSQTDDHLLVKHFYAQLRKVTILDPTCGSGAFLFAALNILEPLYEVCIERMQQWQENNALLFKDELEEINGKYRSNIRYFIYKNIILRNLYGVDIMVEATEIAKLRLFLKMVAVVDVNPRDPNLGLDPLPDIDFNIRCGNTLVGYANERELQEGLVMDFFAQHEFLQKVNDEMEKVSRAYDVFKQVQLTQHADIDTYRNAKKELKNRLGTLNETFNRNLHAATNSGMDYEAWKKSHQPFHWLSEYYDIIKGNGGFDVVIGNPPYVGYTRKNKESKKAICEIYRVDNLSTLPTSNLYAFTIERSYYFMHNCAKIGMIIPISAFANSSMEELQTFIKSHLSNLYISNFHQRPAQLFAGVLQRLSIFIGTKEASNHIFTTGINRWYEELRIHLFNNLSYVSIMQNKQSHIIKIGNDIEANIFEKYSNQSNIASYLGGSNVSNSIFYRTAGGGYWVTFLNDEFDCVSVSNKHALIKPEYNSKVITAALNSNLFWWYYSINYDLFNFKDYMIFGFQLSYNNNLADVITQLSERMENSLRKNAQYYTINSRTNGATLTVTYRKQDTKSIMDEIDKVLAKHYGFTEEELDFIINYDIKYRMGDELD